MYTYTYFLINFFIIICLSPQAVDLHEEQIGRIRERNETVRGEMNWQKVLGQTRLEPGTTSTTHVRRRRTHRLDHQHR